jgi:hypothetical protein
VEAGDESGGDRVAVVLGEAAVGKVSTRHSSGRAAASSAS